MIIIVNNPRLCGFTSLLFLLFFFSYDPAVPDGTSLSGPNGMDSRRNPNFTMKGDTAMNLDEWQKKVYSFDGFYLFHFSDNARKSAVQTDNGKVQA